MTATIVDVFGTPHAVLRGGHAVIHTRDSSFRKAYTVVTMGPILHVDTTSGFIGVLPKYPPPVARSLASAPNVTALPGGVAFKAGDETIAGLGVGGSPGGDKDEVCAQAGVAEVAGLLKKLSGTDKAPAPHRSRSSAAGACLKTSGRVRIRPAPREALAQRSR